MREILYIPCFTFKVNVEITKSHSGRYLNASAYSFSSEIINVPFMASIVDLTNSEIELSRTLFRKMGIKTRLSGKIDIIVRGRAEVLTNG